VPKSLATLTAYDEHGEIVLRMTKPLDDYLEGSIRLMNDVAYRRGHATRFVRCRLYGEGGQVFREELHRYDARGKLIGKSGIDLEALEFGTIAAAKKAIAKLARGHQDAPVSFRVPVVMLTKREMAKGRPIVAVAKELGIPAPTLTRWVAAGGKKQKAPKPKRKRRLPPEEDRIVLTMDDLPSSR
jgi:hypothetical protein